MEAILTAVFIFILASFIGFEIISKVPPNLHTPLMSGSNAVSGIVIVGAILCAAPQDSDLATVMGLLGIVFAMINVVGGFDVTDRMLRMFKRKQ